MTSRSIRPPLKHTPFTELLPDGSQFVSNPWYDWALKLEKAIDTLRVIVGDPDGDGVVDDGGLVDVDSLLTAEVTVFARDMLPTATSGCSALTAMEFGTGQANIHALLFDPTTDESADFHVTLPFSWAGRAFKIYVYFTQGAGATTYGVTWEVTANSTSDDESIILDLPTGSIITETRITQTAKLYITELSEAIPIARELNRDGDLVSLRIYRRPTHASDNLNIDAALIAVRFVLADTAPPTIPATSTEDPYFDSVILLLHGEGTDGSTTFTDSSSYNQTLTVGSGAVQVDTAQYKFGSASITNVGGGMGRIDFSVGAEGDAQEWTVEFWYRRSMTNPMFGLVLSNTNLTIRIGRAADGGTKQHKVLVVTSTYRAESATALSLDTWHHVAVTREWNDPTPTTRVFVDGIKEDEVTTSVGPLVAAGAAWTIGIANEFDGHIDELRISTVCRYTDDFTPQTLPFGETGPDISSGPAVSARWYESNAYTLVSDRIPPAPTGLNCIANFSSATDQVGIAHVSSADGTNAQVTRTGKVFLEFPTGADYGNFIGVLANSGFTAGFPTTAEPFGTTGYYCIHNIDYRTRSPGLITNGTASTNATYDWDPGDTIGMAIDWDTGKVWFHKNTIWLSGDPAAGTSPTFTLPSGAFTIVAGAYVLSGEIQVVDLRARSGTTLLLPPTGFSWYA